MKRNKQHTRKEHVSLSQSMSNGNSYSRLLEYKIKCNYKVSGKLCIAFVKDSLTDVGLSFVIVSICKDASSITFAARI
jgi:hypothetical protein